MGDRKTDDILNKIATGIREINTLLYQKSLQEPATIVGRTFFTHANKTMRVLTTPYQSPIKDTNQTTPKMLALIVESGEIVEIDPLILSGLYVDGSPLKEEGSL